MTVPAASSSALDPHADIGTLAQSVRWLLRRAAGPLAAILGGVAAYLILTGAPGATAFALIAGGSWLALAVWQRGGLGLPLLPVLVFQGLVTYGLPIAIGHPVVTKYPKFEVDRAGLEVLIFCGSLIAAWWLAMKTLTPSSAICHALQGLRSRRPEHLRRLGFGFILGATLYSVLLSLNLLDLFFSLLPDGSYSLLAPVVSAAGTGGFFLVALAAGSRQLGALGRLLFWALLVINSAIGAADFLLSAPATMLAAVALGLFWSTARVPWRYLLIALALLAFFNLGKSAMRERYWPAGSGERPHVGLADLPGRYTQWAKASFALIHAPRATAPSGFTKARTVAERQTLLERINNLQNLLFVIDAVDTGHIPLLGGRTYTMIPPLLVPRIFWPDKPRSHEGQVLLNIHFGRQDAEATATTYIAWGLLPEAYGNFGQRFGALLLGLGLGLICAWAEMFTARKLLFSLEGFLSVAVLLTVMNSFEMVASVLVTAVFQAAIPIFLASFFFVERFDPNRRREPASVTGIS
jgi:hypothetical protein